MDNMDRHFRNLELYRHESVGPSAKEKRGPRTRKPTIRIGTTCPSCGLQRSVTGLCDCNS